MRSKRLEALRQCIRGPVSADVGCDHAWLAIECVRTGRARTFHAYDVNPGPLENARKNVEAAGLQDAVCLQLADGLEKLDPACVEVCIAGMGGHTIAQILEQGKNRLQAVIHLVLSPHSHAEVVRTWLEHNGWTITEEQYVEEEGHFYPLLQAMPGTMELTGAERLYGRNIRQDADFRHFVLQEQAKLERIGSIPAIQKKLEALRQLSASQ